MTFYEGIRVDIWEMWDKMSVWQALGAACTKR